jgi:hypothetical protein
MMTWSRTRTFIAGVALILAANAVALVGVAYNRRGDPESTLLLTQREVSLPYSWGFERENSGVTLTLQWRVLSEQGDGSYGLGMSYAGIGGEPGWLDKTKLSALGFDVSKPEDTYDGRMHYEKLLSKEVLLVLELDGAAYRVALERAQQHLQKEEALLKDNAGKKEFEERVKSAKRQLYQEERISSRLFVVDAGLDVDALRAKFPERTRYAIVRGQVRPHLVQKDMKYRLAGYVSDLSVRQINVPLTYRPVFEPILQNPNRTQPEPALRYTVSVAFGQRLEPWITDIKSSTP